MTDSFGEREQPVEKRSPHSLRMDRVNDVKASGFDWLTQNIMKLMVVVGFVTSIGSGISTYVAYRIQDHDSKVELAQIKQRQAEAAVRGVRIDEQVKLQGDRLDQIVYFQCATNKTVPPPFFCKQVIAKVEESAP